MLGFVTLKAVTIQSPTWSSTHYLDFFLDPANRGIRRTYVIRERFIRLNTYYTYEKSGEVIEARSTYVY